MAYYIAIYDWSLYALPSAIPMTDIEGDTHSNDPAAPGYSSSVPSWIGETFTFNGGASTLLHIDDDDGFFEDAYVETGGAQTLAQDVTINGTTYLAGSVVENEFAMLDGAGNEIWVVRIDGVNVGFAYPAGNDPVPGETFTGAVGRDGNPLDSGDGVGSAEPYNAIVCYTAGALIETPDGPRPVEDLKVGDLVSTIDSGPAPIRWVSRRKVSFRNGLEDAKPVEIKAGAFAPGLPEIDMIVSPQHRFVFHDCAEPKSDGVFVAAKSLTRLPGVRVMRGKKSVEYIHFALARHEVVLACGLLSESCYIGPTMLNDIPEGQRARIAALFPGIRFDPGRGYGPTARPVRRVQDARALLKARQLIYQPAPARS